MEPFHYFGARPGELLTLLGRPEVLPIVLMVAVITALAVVSLRGTRGPARDEPES